MMKHTLTEKEKEGLRELFVMLENEKSLYATLFETFRSWIERVRFLFFVKPSHAC